RNDRCRHRSGAGQASLFDGDRLDVARTASRLRVTVGRIRQLLWAGARPPDKRPATHLVGELVPRGDRGGQRWLIEREEVERFEAAHRSRKARPGYDLTLRPPKSVSVLWALAPAAVRDQVRQAHAASVDAVVDYVEAHAFYARRWNTKGGQDRVATDGVIAAAFDHRTSRAGDPLLHTHVVVANLTRTVEGAWRAVDGRPLFDHARPAGLLYKAHLRHELTARLGVAWGEVRNGSAEIDGIPDPVIRAFSKRREEIEEMVAESGYTSARAYQAATLATRSAKDHGADPDQLTARWVAEAAALGFGPDQVTAVLHRNAPVAAFEEEEVLFAHLAGPAGLTRQASSFTRRDVVEAVSEAVPAACDATRIGQLTDRFLASGHVTALGPDGDEWVWRRGGAKERDVDLARWSTPELIRLEAELLALTTTPQPDTWAPEPEVVDTVLAAAPELSAEQAHMVRGLADQGSSVIQPVSGRPGSGKTYATATYVEALVAAGVPVVGCALSASAAGELEAACRFGPRTRREASTIARLLHHLERHPLTAGSVVVADEASMIGTRDLHRLATHVTKAGGSLKLIGDPLQHGAIDAGGFFRAACAQAGDTLITLVRNNRQTEPNDRAAIEEFRGGMVEAALARYD
ncbi:MAG: MobF family relaxase, partial [Acidimicrobiales bacterium]